MAYHLVIVSSLDTPLFEEELGSQTKRAAERRDERRYLNEFIIHAALDMVDAQVWTR